MSRTDKSIEIESRLVVARTEQGKKQGVIGNVHGLSFLGDGKLPGCDHGDGYITLGIHKTTKLCTSKCFFKL
jgi:hypothetical protein